MFGPSYVLGCNLTEIVPFWQVPANKAIDVLIRSPLPRGIRAGKVALDAERGRELFMFGILGPVVQREGLTTANWELLEPADNGPIRFSSPFAAELGNQDKSALTLDQCV